RQFFPGRKAIINHSGPSFAADSRALGMHPRALEQGRMAKAKKAEEAKEAPEEGAEGEAAPKKGFLSKKLIIVTVAAVLVLGGGGGGTWFFFFKSKPHDEKPAPVAVKPPAFLDMPEVLVNLSGTANGRAQYLKAKIVLEVADQKIVDEIKPV